MTVGIDNKKYFETLALDERLRMDKEADPVLIINALDSLADINFKVLKQTNSLTDSIHQTLGRGLQYPPSPKNNLLSFYSSLKQNLFEMIDQVSNLKFSLHPGKESKDHHTVLNSLDKKIYPNLETIHNLFIAGYHRPSPFTPAQTSSDINFLSLLDHFNPLFTEPVKKVSNLLSGGSKPKVKLNTVETVEELIRVLHDVGLGKIKHLFHGIINYEYYSHLKKVEISSGYDAPYIQGLGDSEVSVFKDSPMWPVAEALMEYVQHNRDDTSLDKVMSIYALITTKSLSSDIGLSYSFVGDSANCSLHIIYDSNQQNHSIDFFCGNKGYFSSKFMSGIKESFSSKGYMYDDTGGENRAFWLSKKSGVKLVKQDVRFILDNLENNLIN